MANVMDALTNLSIAGRPGSWIHIHHLEEGAEAGGGASLKAKCGVMTGEKENGCWGSNL